MFQPPYKVGRQKMRLLSVDFAGRNIQQPLFQKFGKVTSPVRHNMNMNFMAALLT